MFLSFSRISTRLLIFLKQIIVHPAISSSKLGPNPQGAIVFMGARTSLGFAVPGGLPRRSLGEFADVPREARGRSDHQRPGQGPTAQRQEGANSASAFSDSVSPFFFFFSPEFKWVWVKMKPPGFGPQVLVHVSICKGSILGTCF